MKTLREVVNLFVCVILSRFNAVTSIIYVENGKGVTLNPNIQGNPEDILWTFNGNKVAEHDLKDFQEYGQFTGRSKIQITTGELTVLRMTSQDSGIYISEIQIDGKLHNSENQVQVIDAVQEPNVTCILNNITDSKTLFCSVSSQLQTTFEWTGSNSLQQSGQELHISKEEEPDSVFICTVKNKVSQKSTSFTLKGCPTGNPPPDGNIILLVILAIICVIIMGSAAAAVYFILQRRKKSKTDSRRSGDKTEYANLAPLRTNNVQDLNEDGDEPKNAEKTEMMGDHERTKDANLAALTMNHVQDLNEDGDEPETAEKTEMMGDHERTEYANLAPLRTNNVQDLNEDGDEPENDEETERMGDHERNEEVNQAPQNSRDAEKYEEADKNAHVDESEDNEKAGSMNDDESGQDPHSYEES